MLKLRKAKAGASNAQLNIATAKQARSNLAAFEAAKGALTAAQQRVRQQQLNAAKAAAAAAKARLQRARQQQAANAAAKAAGAAKARLNGAQSMAQKAAVADELAAKAKAKAEKAYDDAKLVREQRKGALRSAVKKLGDAKLKQTLNTRRQLIAKQRVAKATKQVVTASEIHAEGLKSVNAAKAKLSAAKNEIRSASKAVLHADKQYHTVAATHPSREPALLKLRSDATAALKSKRLEVKNVRSFVRAEQRKKAGSGEGVTRAKKKKHAAEKAFAFHKKTAQQLKQKIFVLTDDVRRAKKLDTKASHTLSAAKAKLNAVNASMRKNKMASTKATLTLQKQSRLAKAARRTAAATKQP